MNATQTASGSDYVLSSRDFDRLRKVVYSETGIRLSDQKRDLVYNRVVRRLRALGLPAFGPYCDMVEGKASGEIEQLVNAITTNVTSFFRERHHFDFLLEELLPLISATKRERRLRVWSAGCSSGEEPYSLAITLAESGILDRGWDVKVLATDIDTDILARAAEGIYVHSKMEGITADHERRWFLRGSGPNEGSRRVRREIRELITFRQLNLMGSWPMKGPFDFIFCRNVAIYFDRMTQDRLFRRFWELLDPQHGHLLIGHSESLATLQDVFKPCGNTIYRRAC
ncbi:MAG: protein-glutamate O-methyltransferase CheR [bacterium]